MNPTTRFRIRCGLSLVLFVALLSICICTSVSAADVQPVVTLQAGGRGLPVAYLGEYVDLSSVLGGYAGLAYWNIVADPSSDSPSIVVNITSNMRRYYLDPATFKIGIWYRWDGEWEPHGNLEAFQIKSGSRPESNVTVVATPTTTGTTTSATTATGNKTNMIVARGDTVRYTYQYSDTGMKSAYLWLFGDTSYLYGDRLTKDNSTSIYTYNFTPSVTLSLQPGKYTGYLQFIGKRQDVSYNATSKSLETPYVAVPAVSVSGFSPTRVNAEFEKLEQNKEYTDDILVPVTAEIRAAEIRITDYYETNDRIYVRGDSSLSSGTELTFALDPERYTGSKASQLKTYVTYLTGDIDGVRTYSFSFPINRQSLAIGTHSLVVTVNAPVRVSQSVDIEVREIDFIPIPTREPIITSSGADRQIIGSSGWQRVVAANGSVFLESPNGSAYLVPTPTPQIVYVNQTPQIVYVTVTVPVIETQTLSPISAKPTDDIVIPLPPELAGLAVICAGCLFIRFRKE